MTSELVIVSNRLPVNRIVRGRATKWETSPGGLVSALCPILRDRRCIWVGWTGAANEVIPPFVVDEIENWAVPLSSAEVKAYYEGFANRILWPLYHDALRMPDYRQSWWQPYVDVNRRFAEAAAEAVDPTGTVWVHDYHLQLVPAMLREMKPDVRIGFFLHIPFPPQELFAQLPWRREILRGLLGADVVGFQTKVGAQNFAQVCRRFADAAGDDEMLQCDGREVHFGSFPISIDVEQFERLAVDESVLARTREFRTRLGRSRRLLLGIDRLDYTKGIDLRLQAFRELLKSKRIMPGQCVLVQVAVPSREHVWEYKELRLTVERRSDGFVGAVPRGGCHAGDAVPRRHEPGRQGIRRQPHR